MLSIGKGRERKKEEIERERGKKVDCVFFVK
jgi:hypothetical protein